MSSKRVFAVAICVGLAVGGRMAWHSGSVSAASVVMQDQYQLSAAPNLDPFAREADFDTGPNTMRLDRYGNEIDNAMGEYRVDSIGEMYERHSPDTALPHLFPPEV